MAKTGTLGMALQQGLSFSPLLLRIPQAEAVFWPGCALLKLDPAILPKTLAVLRREEPGLEPATGCCGLPSAVLFPEQFKKRQKTLQSTLKSQGIQRIYTACPNCAVQLRALDGIEIIPIWRPLARNLRETDLAVPPGKFILHDPCPLRNDPEQLAAVRVLAGLTGCDVTEPKQSRCCGSAGMLRTTNPAKSAELRRRRLAELDESRTILSPCEGCLDAFRSEGRDTCHLLELLFGRSKTRSWANHIQNTKKVRRRGGQWPPADFA